MLIHAAITFVLCYIAAGCLTWTFITHRRDAVKLALVCEADPIVALLMVMEAIAFWPEEVRRAFGGGKRVRG